MNIKKRKNIDKTEYIKNFAIQKTLRKLKGRPHRLEKIVAKYVSYKVFVINIYKKIYNSK